MPDTSDGPERSVLSRAPETEVVPPACSGSGGFAELVNVSTCSIPAQKDNGRDEYARSFGATRIEQCFDNERAGAEETTCCDGA